jgi:hypothetical protein
MPTATATLMLLHNEELAQMTARTRTPSQKGRDTPKPVTKAGRKARKPAHQEEEEPVARVPANVASAAEMKIRIAELEELLSSRRQLSEESEDIEDPEDVVDEAETEKIATKAAIAKITADEVAAETATAKAHDDAKTATDTANAKAITEAVAEAVAAALAADRAKFQRPVPPQMRLLSK